MIELDTSLHEFSHVILTILEKHYGIYSEEIFSESSLLQYLNKKTVSANRGSKARSSFANIYALYVIVEDYINKGFSKPEKTRKYKEYEGAIFTNLFNRQRELPFGEKLQNHSLNSRMNEEYRKFFPTLEKTPIVRNLQTRRYWIQEDLLLITIRTGNRRRKRFNIANVILEIIDKYIETKQAAFKQFIDTCEQISTLENGNTDEAKKFIYDQLSPNADARIFEVVSYAILKEKFRQESVWIGTRREEVKEENLILYKTGRTNANDGGIDFVMKPIGRFFQVTETIDVEKYFLDIDKVQKFPITFVVKSEMSVVQIRKELKNKARHKYLIESIVQTYMDAVEQIINIEKLVLAFDNVVEAGNLEPVMNEIVVQSKLEFNYE